MKPFKTLFVLFLCFAFTSICYAQKNTVALVDTKSFYATGNGITRLVDALKLTSPNFLSLTTEEKDKKFKRIAKKCRDAKEKTTKNATITLDTKEEVVCVAITDIVESLEEFKKKQEFIMILDISSCDYITDLCGLSVDVTMQFIDEYNGKKK